MEAYIIEASEDRPAIRLDKAAGIYSISGRSLPEDVRTFYKPTLNWIQEFGQNPSPEMNLKVNLEYFNTASSKTLLDIFMRLSDIAEEKGTKIAVHWYYDKEDDDMLEAGQEYSEIAGLPFELIENPKED